MGTESKSKAERRAELIHTRKLFDGRFTAQQLHQEVAWIGKRCNACGGPPAVRARSFAPLDEVLKNAPLAMQIAGQHDGGIPLIDFKGPGGVPVKYVRIGDAYACTLCRKVLEKEAAKAPSFVVVHFDEGPGPEKPVVQVAR